MLLIREYRNRLGMTMKELGDKVGVTESAISLYELGKRKPDYEMLLKLSEALETDISHLLGKSLYSDLQRFAQDEDEVYVSNLMKRLSKDDKKKAVAMLKVMFPDV